MAEASAMRQKQKRKNAATSPLKPVLGCARCEHESMGWDTPEAAATRRRVASHMARQVRRLEEALPQLAASSGRWLDHSRAGQAVWLLAAKEVEFAGLVVAGYRAGKYSAIAALTRTLFEDATLLAWCAVPGYSEEQRPRVLRVLND